jgi:phosphoribosyl-ATP pyrophosphohydrolase
MALYTDKLPLAEGFAAPLQSDRADGLWPTVVTDERGVALGLVYSDLASLRAALEQGRGVYQSRSRGLWVKGASSGATQELLGITADCDRDSLRFTVRQQPPGFCHLETRTCFGAEHGLGALARRLAERRAQAPAGSYTARLFADPALLGAKLREEAGELAEAKARAHVIHEAADVLYFTLATLARHDVELAEVEAALDRRALKVTRRE